MLLRVSRAFQTDDLIRSRHCKVMRREIPNPRCLAVAIPPKHLIVMFGIFECDRLFPSVLNESPNVTVVSRCHLKPKGPAATEKMRSESEIPVLFSRSAMRSDFKRTLDEGH